MAKATGEALEIVTFALDGEVFAIDASGVREILDLVPVTEVPGSRAFVNGLINVRGKVVPLADLRLVFGMGSAEPTVDTRIIVVEIELAGEAAIVGLLADKVFEVTTLAPAALEDTPRIGMRWRPDFIRCIGKRSDGFVIVLEPLAIFAAEKAQVSALASADAA